MQIVYGFIYYFALTFGTLTFALIVFATPFTRKILYRLKQQHGHFFGSDIARFIILIAFALIALILFQSIFAYSTLKVHFRTSKGKSKYSFNDAALQSLDLIPASNQQSYLVQLKEYREYYLAERNIMLSCAAMFIFFIFQRLFYNLTRLAELEHQVGVIKEQQLESHLKTS